MGAGEEGVVGVVRARYFAAVEAVAEDLVVVNERTRGEEEQVGRKEGRKWEERGDLRVRWVRQ